MLLPGGPPLSPSFDCRSAVILRAEQTRRHCQRDAITPRAAVPERVPILATLVLLDANRQAPRSVHLMRPSPFVMPPWRARPAAISGKVAMRIFRTTRTRLSLKCCAHDTAPSGHAGQLGASQAGGSENARHRRRVCWPRWLQSNALALRRATKKTCKLRASGYALGLRDVQRPSANTWSPLTPGTSLRPASARGGSFLTHRGPRSRPAPTSRSKPLYGLQHCLGTCGSDFTPGQHAPAWLN
jgi:hypothetical protein